MAQSASAQTVTVQNTQGIGARMEWATATISQRGGSVPFKAGARNTAGLTSNPTVGTSDKLWLQFDLSSVWATYGQANLASATLTLWGENGNTRNFDVSGLADNAGLDSWTSAGLTWANAPGNNTASGYELAWGSIYSGVPLWLGRADGTLLPLPTGSTLGADYDQCARYISGDIGAFLATDTDGKVTFVLTDGPFNSNQNWWIGASGSYDVNPPYQTDLGEVLRDSPTLTLVFSAIPEPTTLSLLALGLGGLLLVRRRR